MKRCIFYLPYELEEHGARARMIRPRKMIGAFRDIGYDVFEITGYAAQRKQKIAELKRQIRSGERFDFMYSEASTMPTLLTEPHHLPTHPFLDFGFFRYIKSKGIRIGLFYPDAYWKFDVYRESLPWWKSFPAIENYKLDLIQYEKYLSRFYVPNMGLLDHLGSPGLFALGEELPPGADDLRVERKDDSARDFSTDPLTIFYVGGLGSQYQIGELIQAVRQTENCRLILCCREKEWEAERPKLEPLLCDRVEIIHKSGDELEPFYRRSDLCSLLFKQDQYRAMAQPVKAYEYLAHELPVLATEGTGIGHFVEQNGIGWALPYCAEDISAKLQEIMHHPDLLREKGDCCVQTKRRNTWKSRAQQVAEGLSGE